MMKLKIFSILIFSLSGIFSYGATKETVRNSTLNHNLPPQFFEALPLETFEHLKNITVPPRRGLTRDFFLESVRSFIPFEEATYEQLEKVMLRNNGIFSEETGKFNYNVTEKGKTYGSVNNLHYREVLSYMLYLRGNETAKKSNQKVLGLGSATAATELLLAFLPEVSEVHIVDLSEAQIEDCRKFIATELPPKVASKIHLHHKNILDLIATEIQEVEEVETSFERLTVLKGQLDLIVARLCFHFIEDYEIGRFFRVCHHF